MLRKINIKKSDLKRVLYCIDVLKFTNELTSDNFKSQNL